ncbi:MAG TPA: homoserine O-acetyltransferase [Gammaproteobacteria bacterium]|nr:homoserine O-acetyltransferase [Gammaproteobacteria bacterium]
MSGARKIVSLEGPLRMHRGGTLPSVTVAYETWGALGAGRDNAVLIFTGLSPSAHAASSPEDPAPGWWEEMIGAGRPIDTDRHHVICVNSLGSCFGSTGPASPDPRSGRPYRLSFPVLSIEDIARAGRELARALGIERLRAVVGPSMGGMSALAFAMLFPDACGALVCLSSAARATPFAIALRSLQREMIRCDPDWLKGDYAPGKGPVQGMRLARKLGMITYRSAEEWQQRFGRERIPEERKPGDPFGIDFEIESYLENHARKFTGQFDANCYLYLSRAMDLFDAAEHGGSVQAGLDKVRAGSILVVGVETDILFPLHQQRELAEGLARDGRKVDFVALPSIQGHDSFLVDMDRFRPEIGRFFATLD